MVTYDAGVIRRAAIVVCAVLGLGSAACSSPPAAVASPGCHTSGPRVEVHLSSQTPVPVVRIPPGGCVEVTVPRSPFRNTRTEPPTVDPSGHLQLDSDTLHPDGTRSAFYTATTAGTATIFSTVDIHTGLEIPQWSAVVVIH